MQTLRELCLDTIVEKKMSLVDAGKTAVMTMRWRLLAGRSKLNSYSNRKRTAANSRQFDGRYDQAAGVLADRKARQPGRSATATRGPRYRGRTLYVITAILYCMHSGTRSQCSVANASVMWSCGRRWTW